MAVQAVSQLSASYARPLVPRPAPHLKPRMPEAGVPSAHEANRRSKRPRTVACQQCRQAKLRCEGSDGGVRPCNRCRDLATQCVVDNQYKRISKRTTLRDIATQIQLLRAAHTDDVAAPRSMPGDTASLPRSQNCSNGFIGGPAAASVASSPVANLDWNGDAPEDSAADSSGDATLRRHQLPVPTLEPASAFPASREQTIRSVRVTPEEIQHLFQVYFTHYHPLFPVLHSPPSADPMGEGSRLLFWTIILTAARHDSLHFSLLDALVPAVKDLFWSTIAHPPHMLSSLQAMSILCVWPFPTSSMPLDTTYILAGNLRSAAKHAGMHRADRISDFSRLPVSLQPAELQELVKVWCCIYIAVESAATMTGQEPYFHKDTTIEQASEATNPFDLPEVVHCGIMAQQFCNQVHRAMTEVETHQRPGTQSSRVSVLEDLERQLQTLEVLLADAKHGKSTTLYSCGMHLYLTMSTETQRASARFQLRAYWLFHDEDSAARRKGVIQAYDDAINLVSSLAASHETDGPFKYQPFARYQLCFTVGVFVSKVSSSSYGPFLDVDRGKRALDLCVSFCKQASIEDNDLPGRTTKILAQIWNLHRELPTAGLEPPRLSVKCRFLVSIVYDSLWLWRAKYAGQPGNGAPNFPPPFMSPAFTDRSSVTDRSSIPSPCLRRLSGISPTHQESGSTTDQSPGALNIPVPSRLDPPIPSTVDGPMPDQAPESFEHVPLEPDDNTMWDITILNSNLMSFDEFDPYPPHAIEDNSWLQSLN